MDNSFGSIDKKKQKNGKPFSPGQNITRGGPEGSSIGQSKVISTQVTSTPATVGNRSKKKKHNKSKSTLNSTVDSDEDENLSPPSKSSKRRKKTPSPGDSDSVEEDCVSKSQQVSAGARAAGRPQTDLSWELAVEKARGLPDGAKDSDQDEDDEMDEDEIDVDATPPPPPAKAKGKSPKVTEGDESNSTKTKSRNVIQSAAKKLKHIKAKGCEVGTPESPSPKKSAKRKSIDDPNESEQKKSKREQKDLKKQRKAQRASYDIGLRAKGKWEQLRRFDLPLEKRHEISTEIYNLVKGKTKDLVFAHDTSRVIQCMMKYGLQEHKNALFEELSENVVEMTKSKYAKFLVRKLLKYGTKAQRNYVFRKLSGNVRKLIKHKDAGEIVECAYSEYANATQRNSILEEFYGPSYAVFKTAEQKTLQAIIEANPEKGESILRFMKEALTSLVDKSVLQFSIVHKVFLDFFTFANDKLKTEMIECVREGLIHMVHTREGARVAMIALWHGTAKDRKVVVKSFKTFVSKICCEEYGHLVLLSLFDVVDDTKLVAKVILEELQKCLLDVSQDQFGRKVLLYLLSPRDPTHFHPDIVRVLIQGDGNANSKKDISVRQRELLEAISRPLIQFIKQHCRDLVTNNASLLLILCILTHATGDPTDAMRAVSELTAEPFVAGSLDNFHIVEHSAGHMTLKRLIVNDNYRMERGEKVLFSQILLDVLPDGSLKSWAACNRGCYILLSLLELKNLDVQKRVTKALAGIHRSLSKMNFKGAKVLLEKLQ